MRRNTTAQRQNCASCDKIEIPDRVLNRMIDRAMLDRTPCGGRSAGSTIPGLNSAEPRCFAPHVDVTRARQAYGRLALPKLTRELRSQDGEVVRQAVTSIADISINPEEIARMIELRIPESLADLLLSEDSYLRERVAIIYGTIGRQAIGREAIFRYTKILCNLSKGLRDPLDAVRIKIARVIKNLAFNPIDAENLCTRGFLEMLVGLIKTEKDNAILAVHLECLESLLNGSFKIRAIEIKTMEKLLSLLSGDDETIVAGALSCLSVISHEPMAKQKIIDLDILSIMKKLLYSPVRLVYKKAAATVVFATTTTPGKLRAVALDMIDKLVELASVENDPELQIISMQALSNIAELPVARSRMLERYSMFIEDIDSRRDETVERHKIKLLKIIRSRP